MNTNNDGKQRHGFSVYWNETNEVTGATILQRRDFITRAAALEFSEGVPNSRVFDPPEQTPKELDQIDRDDTDKLNRQRMVELMLEHNITIPAKQFDKWRPTEEKTGHIAGVANGLKIIMTDGLLGYFIRGDREPLYGHVQHFKWDEPNISFVPYIDEHGEQKFFKQVKDSGAPPALYKRTRKPTPPRKKKGRVPMTAASALELIQKMKLEMGK